MNKKNNTKNTLFYRTQGRHRRIHKNTREVGEMHNEAPKTKKKRTNHTIKLLMVSSIKYRNKTCCLQCIYANSAAWCV